MALVGGVDEEETLAPTCLRLLVIDASASSRSALCALLKQCSYEVRPLGSLKGGELDCLRGLSAWPREWASLRSQLLAAGHGRADHHRGSAPAEGAAGQERGTGL